jgi:hypothetical protein
MSDEVQRQQEPIQENQQDQAPATSPELSHQCWEHYDQNREVSNPGSNSIVAGSVSDTTSGSEHGHRQGESSPHPTELHLPNPFQNARDSFHNFLNQMGIRGREAGAEKQCKFVSPDSCASCSIPEVQRGMIPQNISSDISARERRAAKAEETLKEVEGGKLEREVVRKNQDGSSITIKTKEEYVRDEKGAIKKDEKGRDLTRVLEEDKEAKDKDGKTTFKSHKENQYNDKGDLTDSKTDIFRVDTKGELSKYNSFVVKNEYDANGRIGHQHTSVLDKDGKEVQSADARYGYDEHGNKTSEDIERRNGTTGRTQREHREHTYGQFGDKWEKTGTVARLFDQKGEEQGELRTKYDRRADGSLEAEHTTEVDSQERVTHQFDAIYDKYGYRLTSRDTHQTYHANGAEHTTTVSEFNALGDSSSTRIEKDEKGEVVNKTGIVQQEDGTIVNAHKPEQVLLSADAGQALGGYWDKETAWNSLERLSGDATNRDALRGFEQLGRFAGGPGMQEAAVGKLEKWGQGDATRGIDILESNWGNGSGRAGQGMETYLSMGTGAALKEAKEKGAQGVAQLTQAVTNFLSRSAESGSGWKKLNESMGTLSEAVTAMSSAHKHAERYREQIDKDDADVAGDLVSARGNGNCADGVCEIKKDGDEGVRQEKPGEPDSFGRGLEANLAWSPTGSFGDALRLRSDIAGGDMVRLGQITETMGTTETIGENGEVVTSVSRLAGNDNMLRLGTVPAPEGLVGTDGKVLPGVTISEDGKSVLGTDGKPVAGVTINAEGQIVGRDGKVIEGLSVAADGRSIEGTATRRIDPEQAADQFKRAGTTPEGYQPTVAAQNFFESGVTTAMTTDSQGRPTPVLDAQGNPVYLRSAERGVEAVVTIGGGNPVTGMDAMEVLSTKKDANGEVISVDMRTGFTQLPMIGERLHATENGTVVAVRDVQVSANTILNYGQPALDAQGNPVPVRDAEGNIIPQGVVGAEALVEVTRTKEGTDPAQIYSSLQAANVNERRMFADAVREGKVEPGETFSPAESTRESLQFIGRTPEQQRGSALEGARLLTVEQTAADGRTFTVSPDGSVVGALNTIRKADSAPEGQQTVIGGAMEVALMSARAEGQPADMKVARDAAGFPTGYVDAQGNVVPMVSPITAGRSGGTTFTTTQNADGSTTTVNRDGTISTVSREGITTVFNPVNNSTTTFGKDGIATTTITNSDGTTTTTTMASSLPTFTAGSVQVASMANRFEVGTDGKPTTQPVDSSQLFTQGISNVQAYSREGNNFSEGRQTIQTIGGGADNPQAIPQGVREIRTAADTTTGGSVTQMAEVTRTAGGGDPMVGAQALMSYNGRTNADGTPNRADGSYSKGAAALYSDLYGSPTAPQNVAAGQTLQPRDVERAVSLASPGTAPQQQLQAGMDKTNEIVRSSGNPELTGSHVLTNLSNNQPAFEAVRTAPTPVAAREALQTQGVYQAIVTPIPATVVTGDKTNLAVTSAEQKLQQLAAQPKTDAAFVAQPLERAMAQPTIGQQPVYTTANSTERFFSSPVGTAGSERSVVANNATVAATLTSTSTDRREAAAEGARAVVAGSPLPRTMESMAREGNATVAAAQALAVRQQTEARNAEIKAANDENNRRLVAGNAPSQPTSKPEIQIVGNLFRTFGSSESALFKSGSQAASSLASIINSQKGSGFSLESTTRIASALMAAPSLKSVGISGVEAVQRATVAHGNVNLNIANSQTQAHFLKASFSAAAANAAEMVRAARQAEMTSLRAASVAAAASVRMGDGAAAHTARSIAGAAAASHTGSANTARSMDLMIARSLVRGDCTNGLVAGDLKVSRARIKKIKRLGEDELALLGAEIALAALLVSAAIAKEKTEGPEAKKAKKGNAELAKLSDALDEVAEFIADDKANAAAAYQVLTRSTWLVRPNEDLVKLAEHLFHEAELGWLIADLNMSQTKESYVDGKRIVELKVRQRIEIPTWQDIVDFHNRRPENAIPENLVTIVNENAIDTELMNATLGVAMGATTAPVAAPVTAAAKPQLVIAGLAPTAKEGDRRPLLASAKRAALVVRNAAKAAVKADSNDQDPTAPAVATTDELQPKYV